MSPVKAGALVLAALFLSACGGEVANTTSGDTSGNVPATSTSNPSAVNPQPQCGGIDSAITDKGNPDQFTEGADVAGTTLAGGLKVADLQQGTGTTVVAGQCLSVQYTGWLDNGTMFDSSRKGVGGFKFQIGAGNVIPGWDQGLIGMKTGGRRRLTIPPALGYGAQGSPPSIPGNSTLVFIVEVIKAV